MSRTALLKEINSVFAELIRLDRMLADDKKSFEEGEAHAKRK
jgi:hypothetical protein